MIKHNKYSKMLKIQADMCYPFEHNIYKSLFSSEKKNIAEIGCGNGFLLNKLKNNFPLCSYTGYDIDKDMINDAEKKYPKIKFVLGSIHNIDRCFDIVLLRLIMHQIEKRKDFISDMTKKLSSSAKVVIIDADDSLFSLSPSLPFFLEHLAAHRKELSRSLASRDIKEKIINEMFDAGFNIEKSINYYIPSTIPNYKDLYKEYMITTCEMTRYSNNVINEILSWHEDPDAYAQIGLFIHVFSLQA